MNKQRIAIFCGASGGNNDEYQALASEIVFEIHKRKYELVYGGAGIGLMGKLANAMLNLGGHVIGVIPESLCIKEVAHDHLSELKVVKNMHERKELMYQLSTAFLILPGGMGTLDEFFEILTWKQLGQHSKPIVLYNYHGYFDHLIKWMEHAIQSGFIKKSDQDLFYIISNFKEMPWEKMHGNI